MVIPDHSPSTPNRPEDEMAASNGATSLEELGLSYGTKQSSFIVERRYSHCKHGSAEDKTQSLMFMLGYGRGGASSLTPRSWSMLSDCMCMHDCSQ